MDQAQPQDLIPHQELIIKAASVDQAVETAARQLGQTPDEIEYEILDEGSSGILGIGSRPARIKVLPPDVARELQAAQVGRQVLEELLSHMGIKAQVSTYESVMDAGVSKTLQVASPDASLIIGRQGQSLRDLEYMTRLIASRRLHHWPFVHVDVDGYRARRWRHLRTLAAEAAEKVRYSAQPVPLPPMPAWERRIIHHSLQSDPDVTTKSLGQDQGRHVVVWPASRAHRPSASRKSSG